MTRFFVIRSRLALAVANQCVNRLTRRDMDTKAYFARIYCVILYRSSPRDKIVTINPKIEQGTKRKSNEYFIILRPLPFRVFTCDTIRNCIMLRNVILDGRYGPFKPINTAVDWDIEVEN